MKVVAEKHENTPPLKHAYEVDEFDAAFRAQVVQTPHQAKDGLIDRMKRMIVKVQALRKLHVLKVGYMCGPFGQQ